MVMMRCYFELVFTWIEEQEEEEKLFPKTYQYLGKEVTLDEMMNDIEIADDTTL
jgi:hypothetical protein